MKRVLIASSAILAFGALMILLPQPNEAVAQQKKSAVSCETQMANCSGENCPRRFTRCKKTGCWPTFAGTYGYTDTGK